MQKQIVTIVPVNEEVSGMAGLGGVARSIAALIERDQLKIIVDWRGVDFVNPMALGHLLSKVRLLRDLTGDLKFARMEPAVKRIFFKFRVAEFVENFATLEGAIESFDDEWEEITQGRA